MRARLVCVSGFADWLRRVAWAERACERARVRASEMVRACIQRDMTRRDDSGRERERVRADETACGCTMDAVK